MSRNDLKHGGSILLGIGRLLLCSIFAFGWGYFYTGTKPQHKALIETTTLVFTRVFRKPLSTPQETLTDFQKSDFYQTIVDNNLFRPLGWHPPRLKEPYRLLGTILPADGKHKAQAIVQNTAIKGNHTVRIGGTLNADTIIVDIQPKQVTLEKAGMRRTLHLNITSLLK